MLAELERAWLELDADPDVRVIVNTGDGSAFQTGLDVVQLSRDPRRAARAVPADQRRRAALHGLAQPGRGSRSSPRSTACAPAAACTSWPTPTSSSRRRTPPSSTRTCRSGRWPRTRTSRSCGSRRWSRSCAWRWSAGTSGSPRERAYQLGILQPGRRPARAAARRATQALAEKIAAQLARRDARPRSGRCGARSRWASPTPAGPAPSELVVDVGPPRPDRGPAGLRREARAAVADPLDAPPPREATAMKYSDLRLPAGRAARPGRLADQQPARPAQRDVGAHARRVRGRVEGARRRPRRAGDRPHRQRAGRSRPAST